MGIEPMTSSLPRKCSTAELSRLFSFQFQPFSFNYLKTVTDNCPLSNFYWSGRRGSNSRPIAWKAIALPTELLPLLKTSD